MSRESVRVFAPASVSNVGPGFDIMGFAIDSPGDEIVVSKNESDKLGITEITGDNGVLSSVPEQNTVTVAVKSLLNHLGISDGIDIQIHKKMGIGSGLGSSAASAVGGVVAVNELLGLKLSKDELLPHALAGEALASGAIHADNVAPCLYGGFLLIRAYDPVDIIHIPAPENLYCVIIYPQIVVKTSEARKILPANFTMKDVVTQAGNSGALIAGLYSGDFELISRSLVDRVAEPYRAKLLPFYEDIRDAAKQSGAMNCNISGSGPSLFSFCKSMEEASRIKNALKAVVLNAGFEVNSYISKINRNGPGILD